MSPRRAQSAANCRNYLETRGRYVPDAHRDNFVLGLIFFTSLGMIPGVHYAGGSHLLGAFLAGLCYCTDHRTHHVWTRQVKRVMKWIMTLFSTTLPLRVASHVWDLYFLDGIFILYQTSIAILRLLRPKLMQEDMEGIMQILQKV